MTRFKVQYRPASSTRLMTLPFGSWQDARDSAVEISCGGALDVSVLRFDADAGWSVAGVMTGPTDRPVFTDLRTPERTRHDTAAAVIAHEATLARSRRRLWALPRRVEAGA